MNHKEKLIKRPPTQRFKQSPPDRRETRNIGGLLSLTVIYFLVSTLPLNVAAQSHSAAPQLSNPRILVLHSYHEGFTWTDNVTRGIQSVFTRKAPEIELLFEFMDVKRLYTDEYLSTLKEFYQFKYADQTIDVIISSDDHALEFLLGLGQDLFPNVPVVFCAVNGYDPAKHRGDGRQLTGVVESIDIKATLDVALKFHPKTEEVAVITDRTLTGRALKANAEKIFRDYEDRVHFTYFEHLTMEQLWQEVSTLPEEAIVFAFIFTRDQFGRIWSHEYNLERLASHCKVPIYSVWEFYLGHGIVGGMLTSGQAHGEMAAQMALRILHGETATEIPVVLKSPNRYMFDYDHLKRFDVKESSLPEDSIVVNKSFSVYEEYKPLIWSVALFILLLLVIVVILIKDIVLRRRTEETLEEERNLLRTLIDNMPDYIYVKDTESRFILGNTAVAQVMGATTPGELFGKTDFDFYPRELAAQYYANEQEVIQSGCPEFNREELVINPSGSRIWILTTQVPLRDSQGRVVGLVGIGRDITERQRAEEALRESENRFSTFMEYFPANVTIKDDESKFLFANKHMRDLFDIGTWSGKTARDYFPPEIAERVLATDRQTIEEGPIVFEEAVPIKTGEIRIFETWKFPITRKGKPDLIGIISIDITARKQAEEEIRKLNTELEERVKQRTAELETANKELKDFAYVVSHDLKAPLRGISRLAQWLVADYTDVFDEQGEEMIDLLVGRVKRMDNLIEGILQYSRVGRLIGRDEQIDLNTLVKDVIDILAPPEHIQIVIENELPLIAGDKIRIAQVFQNLLENGVKFMDKPDGMIRIGCIDENEHWTFSITDNGPGINSKYHKKIFQIFQTLQPRDVIESTGIGLALVKKIIELHGGKIWIESMVGDGSTFYFTFPKEETTHDETQKGKSEHEG